MVNFLDVHHEAGDGASRSGGGIGTPPPLPHLERPGDWNPSRDWDPANRSTDANVGASKLTHADVDLPDPLHQEAPHPGRVQRVSPDAVAAENMAAEMAAAEKEAAKSGKSLVQKLRLNTTAGKVVAGVVGAGIAVVALKKLFSKPEADLAENREAQLQAMQAAVPAPAEAAPLGANNGRVDGQQWTDVTASQARGTRGIG